MRDRSPGAAGCLADSGLSEAFEGRAACGFVDSGKGLDPPRHEARQHGDAIGPPLADQPLERRRRKQRLIAGQDQPGRLRPGCERRQQACQWTARARQIRDDRESRDPRRQVDSVAQQRDLGDDRRERSPRSARRRSHLPIRGAPWRRPSDGCRRRPECHRRAAAGLPTAIRSASGCYPSTTGAFRGRKSLQESVEPMRYRPLRSRHRFAPQPQPPGATAAGPHAASSLLAAAVLLLGGLRRGPAPQISVRPERTAIGRQAPLEIEVSEPSRGFAKVEAELVQGTNRMALLSESFRDAAGLEALEPRARDESLEARHRQELAAIAGRRAGDAAGDRLPRAGLVPRRRARRRGGRPAGTPRAAGPRPPLDAALRRAGRLGGRGLPGRSCQRPGRRRGRRALLPRLSAARRPRREPLRPLRGALGHGRRRRGPSRRRGRGRQPELAAVRRPVLPPAPDDRRHPARRQVPRQGRARDPGPDAGRPGRREPAAELPLDQSRAAAAQRRRARRPGVRRAGRASSGGRRSSRFRAVR